jgi:hypothetical protein
MDRSFPSDEALIRVYRFVRIPSDRIMANSHARSLFMQALPPQYCQCDSNEIAGRLITLRKKNLLPRLVRAKSAK